mmetsp:Transcript_6554/g.13438  ORF Transcript_6554/g.13438 Transcript_6554/m.13438 type:complete len:581 (-) Transcript_6554:56-1798(-)|eukprot:CAMPEP_0171356276 /NCGR_PEP_ID=MMETSP0878-20121228/45649_1 /TAXON_ID=67004 /ORGANISM="Thalassiosira weissflogii, Strain CCMP1336" /LENGTH=580 /DNA_ID=CAMNT_0011862295 /DNA_START=129 /DNA_END=1871 /DNA_ORIENTATION=-
MVKSGKDIFTGGGRIIRMFPILGCTVIGTFIGYIGGKMQSFSSSSLSFVTSGSTHHGYNGSCEILHSYKPRPTVMNGNIVGEIVPDSLIPLYDPKFLQFNVTRSMLQKSRPVVGNTQRLHSFLKKLHAKHCTTVLFLGGSVTAGHNTKGGLKDSFPRFFMDWLNERYPCENSDRSLGKHLTKRTQQNSAQTNFISWDVISVMETLDLVIIEFNVNDSFIAANPHALEDKGREGASKDYISVWYNEILLRRLLLLRKPDPVAIITFNADYIGRTWAPKPYSDPDKDRKTTFRNNQEPLKFWLSSMYEIPMISASTWMLPFAGKKGTNWQFNRNNSYSTSLFHADKCCHPKRGGHLILSLVLAYCLLEEEKNMFSSSNDVILDIEQDFSAAVDPILRDPMYLSEDEERMYVRHDSVSQLLDFTDPSGHEKWKNQVCENDGWNWFADNREKDKFGLIANNVTGGQHISLEVTGGKLGLVELSYVISYENFGVALSWVDDSRDGGTHRPKCKNEIWEREGLIRLGGVEYLFGSWDEKASVPMVTILKNRVEEGGKGYLHICLTPHSTHRQGNENKFKLLGVRLY